MNYEYKATGGLNINKNTQCKTSTESSIEIINIPIIIIPNKKVVRTKRYSVLLNGSIATGGFNDKDLDLYILKDRAA